MAIDIVGAGGIGCSVAAALLRSATPFRLIERDPAKLDFARSQGLRLNGQHLGTVQVVPFDDWQPPRGGTVLLCVKCYDNAAVLDRINGEQVIPIQNGYDPLLEAADHAHEAIASFVAHCEPGTLSVRITRPGDLHIGPRRNAEPLQILSALSRGPFQLRPVSDIRPIKAAKLMYNAAISPLAAAAGADNGKLLDDALARRLFFALLQENHRILRAANIPLGKVGPFHPNTVRRILQVPGLPRLLARFFAPSLRGTYCSMAGDIERGRTELENYTGHLLRLAAGRVPAPINAAVYRIVSSLKRPDGDILERISLESGFKT